MLANRANKRYGLIALVGTVIQFLIFKLLYPFPDFISDSYSYIDTNLYHMDVNLWPIGYSKFLSFVHLISHSDTLLVAIQYSLLELSLAHFFFTILFLYRPAKKTTLVLFLFVFFNPLFLYLSNCVLSDAIFTALSIIFFTQFLWMLHRPALRQVIIQGVIIALAFTIRYTAIYYPLVAIAGLALSRHKKIIKISGSVLGIVLIIPFIIYTQQKTKGITGTGQFSVFGGWQIANNVLYMYDHINVDSNTLPNGTKELDQMARNFYREVPSQYRDFSSFPGTYFIKVPYAVLKPYMIARYTYDDPPSQFRAWGLVSPIYEKYGTYLITHFPLAFARYYIWLNTKTYFLPHLEKFGSYNLDINTVPSHVQDWFGYITPDVYAVFPRFQGKLFYIFPVIFMALNVFVAGSLLRLLSKHHWRTSNTFFRKTVLLTVTFLMLNFIFSVLATPVVLRYQVVPMILLCMLSLLLLEFPDNPNQSNQSTIHQ
jgi:hypothetical protein